MLELSFIPKPLLKKMIGKYLYPALSGLFAEGVSEISKEKPEGSSAALLLTEAEINGEKLLFALPVLIDGKANIIKWHHTPYNLKDLTQELKNMDPK